MTATVPPPAPPPAIAEESSGDGSAPPLLAEKKKPPALTHTSLADYFSKELIFPRHIPETALCDVGSMLSLVARHGEAAGGARGGDGGARDDTARAGLRRLAAQCATYKDKATLNHNEFRHKRSVELREQLQREDDGDGDDDDAVPAVERPPYHPEYTPLPVPGNYLLTKIHGANYNICLAKASCPRRMERLLTCWNGTDPERVRAMEREGTEARVCAEERGGVERCVGLSVQRAMRELLG